MAIDVGRRRVPAATQADLAAALTTTLHDSTGTGTGSVDWNFNIADHDLDFLAAGQTLTVNYNVKVSDASTNANQTVSVVITGANDAVDDHQRTGIGFGRRAGRTSPDRRRSTPRRPVPTGTLDFTDVDLSDTPLGQRGGRLPPSGPPAAASSRPTRWTICRRRWRPRCTIPPARARAASTGLSAIQDKDLDFLAAGETLTVTYDVTVVGWLDQFDPDRDGHRDRRGRPAGRESG